MKGSPVNQVGNSGIQQVIDMNNDGDISTSIKVDYLVDSIRGLKLAVAFLVFLCAMSTISLMWVAYDNYRTSVEVRTAIDTVNKRHFLLSKEYCKKVYGERIE